MTMQDRFLFRAICNDGKFHYGYLSRLYEDRGEGKKGDFCISNNSFCPYAYLVTRPETIGQCTGIKDKNGKLIYEGDIIENGAGKRYVIFWCPEKLGFVARTNNPNKVLESLDIYYMPWKVIGNIHENPELLESEER